MRLLTTPLEKFPSPCFVATLFARRKSATKANDSVALVSRTINNFRRPLEYRTDVTYTSHEEAAFATCLFPKDALRRGSRPNKPNRASKTAAR